MIRLSIISGIVMFLVGLLGLGYIVYHRKNTSSTAFVPQTKTTTQLSPSASAPAPTPTPAPAPTPAAAPVVTKPTSDLVLPIDQFYDRITKKTFGLYVTPENSPVQPEKFTGYHTGVDVEYGDVTSDVPVKAMAAGTVMVSKIATGYGGVIAVKHTIDGKSVVAIYGHLRPSSMKSAGSGVAAGEQIAVLGSAFSTETSGERRHLHFGMRADGTVSILGYAQKQSDLSGWQDPVAFYKGKGI